MLGGVVEPAAAQREMPGGVEDQDPGHALRPGRQRALCDRLRLVEAAQAREPPACVASKEQGVGPHADALGHTLAFERELSGLVEPTLLVEANAEVDVGARRVVLLGKLLGDAHRVAQRSLAAYPVARHGHGRTDAC